MVYFLVAGGLWTAVAEDGGGKRPRPEQWARPLDLEGVPNLHKVSDGLYRSAQPTAEGMANLKKMGIETVVNLRALHSDRDEIGETGLAYEHIYMKAWSAEEREVVRFLQVVCNPRRQPVLVHCQFGADRTGTMCALYRIIVEGWSKEEALREMREGGIWLPRGVPRSAPLHRVPRHRVHPEAGGAGGWGGVASGRWPVAGGRWPVAGGLWPVAGGLWPVAGGR